MLRMGSTSQVTNCDWFIHEIDKGVAPVRNVRDIDRALVKPFIGYSGQFRERLEIMWQSLFQDLEYGG